MNSWRPLRWILAALSLTMIATILLVPPGATAQSGPQFGNWGPGMAPPDSEGVDPNAGSASSGYGSVLQQPLPPGMAPGIAPDSAMAPANGLLVRGCPYDLRGVWRNEGRQYAYGYSGSSRSYTATVSVRQFRTWIQAQQDDGTAYYGQCLGNRLVFDMYNGSLYVGRQEGTIYGSTWYAPGPLYGDPLLPAAGAPSAMAPAPWGTPSTYIARPALYAGFSWTSTYGSGTETWTLTTAAFPGPINPGPILYPPPFPPVSSPTPTATATAIPTPSPTPMPATATLAADGPRITEILPARGPAGTEVLVIGSGFAADDNMVTFGPSLGLRRPDGTPANLVARGGSSTGATLRFTVPHQGPSGILCDANGSCAGITSLELPQPASYEVTVINTNGASNVARFDLVGAPAAAAVEPEPEVAIDSDVADEEE